MTGIKKYKVTGEATFGGFKCEKAQTDSGFEFLVVRAISWTGQQPRLTLRLTDEGAKDWLAIIVAAQRDVELQAEPELSVA